MIGTEYSLLHVQDPILYVIRKAHRQSTDKGAGLKKLSRSHSPMLLFTIFFSSDAVSGLLHTGRCGLPVPRPGNGDQCTSGKKQCLVVLGLFWSGLTSAQLSTLHLVHSAFSEGKLKKSTTEQLVMFPSCFHHNSNIVCKIRPHQGLLLGIS